MRREMILLGAAVLYAAVSCETSRLETRRNYPSTVEEHPETVVVRGEALFMTAVAYPEGYDWKKDPEYGEVECSLLFYRGDSLLSSRPAGSLYQSSSDTDMHRIVGADLYEDYSTDEETVILKNGREEYRLPGRERLIDVVMRDSVIYSIGASRDNGGYILRRDWKLVSQSASIQPVGGFYEDKGKLCFSGASSLAGGGVQWFTMTEEDALPVSPPKSTHRIQALRKIKDHEVMVLAVGKESHCYVEGVQIVLEDGNGRTLFLPEIYYSGDYVYVDGNVYDSKSGLYIYKVWVNGALLKEQKGFRREATLFAPGRMVALGRDSTDDRWKLMDNFTLKALPEGYKAHSSYAMCLHEDTLYVALVDENGQAAIWENGKVRKLGFNGFVDRLAYSEFTTTKYVTGRN